MDLVSIIVSVCNTEMFLAKCLESIINQTYRNLEIILVDDGSTDSSGKICDEFAERDERIKIIHRENGGVSSARNAGIERALGKYIAFYDSDDIIAPEMIEILYKNIIKTNADMSCCSFFKFYDENQISFNANENYSVLISGNRRYYEVLTGVFLGGFIWNKLYRKSVVLHSNIKFENDIAVSEDALFNAEYIKSSGKICFTDSVLYGYRMHSKSVLHQKFNLKKLTDITAKEKIYDLVESEVDSDLIISNIWEALMKSYVHAYKSIFLKNKAEEKAWKIKIKKGFNKYRYKNSINSSWNYKDKICLLLLKCFSK